MFVGFLLLAIFLTCGKSTQTLVSCCCRYICAFSNRYSEDNSLLCGAVIKTREVVQQTTSYSTLYQQKRKEYKCKGVQNIRGRKIGWVERKSRMRSRSVEDGVSSSFHYLLANLNNKTLLPLKNIPHFCGLTRMCLGAVLGR